MTDRITADRISLVRVETYGRLVQEDIVCISDQLHADLVVLALGQPQLLYDAVNPR